MAESILEFIFTPHATVAMGRRNISKDVVEQVLASPEQRRPVRPGREVLQSRFQLGDRLYLIRVFVDVLEDPPQVVTAYRTSKIEKYWSGS